MNFLELKFRSQALGRNVSVNVLLPDLRTAPSKSYKTLWLLHGLTDDHTAWMRNSSIERYASDRGLAVVMPAVERSWYTDTAYGSKYFTFINEELPTFCRAHFKGMSDTREDNIIGGLSMGGYGAIKSTLTFPERYGACISLSGSLDITRKGRALNLPEWRSIFDFALEGGAELEGTDHDVFALLRRRTAAELPPFYLWCGVDDALIHTNRNFHALLTERGMEHTFRESEGNHSWKWWDLHIQDALDTVLSLLG